jgi:hypothetical protein
MPRYSVYGVATNTNNEPLVTIAQPASPTRRIAIYDIMIGAIAAVADAACGYEFQRFSAEAGTPGGTALTPRPLDEGDGAAAFTAQQAPTTDPTLTAGAYLLYVPLNQRATFRWVASPGGELVVPNTATNKPGIAVMSDLTGGFSAYAVNVNLHVQE